MYGLLLVIIYVSFVSLGLPDSLLGSSWPVVQEELSLPFSAAGVIAMVISLCTVASSLSSDFLIRRIGTGKIVAISTLLTAIGLVGFAFSSRLWHFFVWALPYGLGAGSIDAVLNNYVALHYKSQHMSWLHCMWGLGASLSPYIMSFSLMRLSEWRWGYGIVAILQGVLAILLFCCLPIWKKGVTAEEEAKEEAAGASLSLKSVLAIPGVKSWFLAFFAYCALEITACLWASSYLVEVRGLSAEVASGLASLCYIGITVGRLINGFLSMKLGDKTLIRMGAGILSVGILLVILPLPTPFALAGLLVIGLGCAPVYPCVIHATPILFGRERSQSIIGVQLSCAYLGFSFMPPLFGVIAEHLGVGVFPWYLFALLALMVITHEAVQARFRK